MQLQKLMRFIKKDKMIFHFLQFYKELKNKLFIFFNSLFPEWAYNKLAKFISLNEFNWLGNKIIE